MKARCSRSLLGILSIAALLSPAIAAEPGTPPKSPDPAAPCATCSTIASPEAPAKSLDPAADMAKVQKMLDRDELPEAFKLLHQLAEQNYIPAQSLLGEYVEAAMDYDEAVGWFIMAASQGDPAGQYDLGRMYESGTGIQPDLTKALYWVKQAANKKFIPAVDKIAKAYKTGGLGLKVDPEQARAWEARLTRLVAEKKAADIATAAQNSVK